VVKAISLGKEVMKDRTAMTKPKDLSTRKTKGGRRGVKVGEGGAKIMKVSQ